MNAELRAALTEDLAVSARAHLYAPPHGRVLECPVCETAWPLADLVAKGSPTCFWNDGGDGKRHFAGNCPQCKAKSIAYVFDDCKPGAARGRRLDPNLVSRYGNDGPTVWFLSADDARKVRSGDPALTADLPLPWLRHVLAGGERVELPAGSVRLFTRDDPIPEEERPVTDTQTEAPAVDQPRALLDLLGRKPQAVQYNLATVYLWFNGPDMACYNGARLPEAWHAVLDKEVAADNAMWNGYACKSEADAYRRAAEAFARLTDAERARVVGDATDGPIAEAHAALDAKPDDRGLRGHLARLLKAAGSELAEGYRALAACGLYAGPTGNGHLFSDNTGACAGFKPYNWPAHRALPVDWFRATLHAGSHTPGVAGVNSSRKDVTDRVAKGFLSLPAARRRALLAGDKGVVIANKVDELHAALDVKPADQAVRAKLAEELTAAGSELAPGYRALAKLGAYPMHYPELGDPSQATGWLFNDGTGTSAHGGPDKTAYCNLPKDWRGCLKGGVGWTGFEMTRRQSEDAAARAFLALPEARRLELVETPAEAVERLHGVLDKSPADAAARKALAEALRKAGSELADGYAALAAHGLWPYYSKHDQVDPPKTGYHFTHVGSSTTPWTDKDGKQQPLLEEWRLPTDWFKCQGAANWFGGAKSRRAFEDEVAGMFNKLPEERRKEILGGKKNPDPPELVKARAEVARLNGVLDADPADHAARAALAAALKTLGDPLADGYAALADLGRYPRHCVSAGASGKRPWMFRDSDGKDYRSESDRTYVDVKHATLPVAWCRALDRKYNNDGSPWTGFNVFDRKTAEDRAAGAFVNHLTVDERKAVLAEAATALTAEVVFPEPPPYKAWNGVFERAVTALTDAKASHAVEYRDDGRTVKTTAVGMRLIAKLIPGPAPEPREYLVFVHYYGSSAGYRPFAVKVTARTPDDAFRGALASAGGRSPKEGDKVDTSYTVYCVIDAQKGEVVLTSGSQTYAKAVTAGAVPTYDNVV